jgi:predicted RNA binding protein YcfA (HicA-like mRNA interferase family)
MSGRQLRRLLEQNGVVFVRQRGTSHAIFERVVAGKKCRAPMLAGAKELSPKYIKLVLRQLGFSDEDIQALFPD